MGWCEKRQKKQKQQKNKLLLVLEWMVKILGLFSQPER
jgi:hypothetical protein